MSDVELDDYTPYKRINDGKKFLLKRLVDRSYIVYDPLDGSRFGTTDYFVRKYFKAERAKLKKDVFMKPKRSEQILLKEARARLNEKLLVENKRFCLTCNTAMDLKFFSVSSAFGKPTSKCRLCVSDYQRKLREQKKKEEHERIKH